ncbi:thioredoxin family protein [Aliarcobacter butzleri]|uniref:thioredoxin family protein n=1 Tax=Aliarcobacter butzleri TaxID=28197 RepID=UPI00263DED3A|nr:thioredoxin family protein [Aliarcobacter butzleri]MDN5077247.1 thioredoxin family protein [Aliarcobacter butzleri]MDN5118923.1 thioredoxin family protein [Aliarcobacter butzleri]
MTQIENEKELKKVISENQAIILYFSGDNCSVCKVLKPKIETEVSKNFPKMKLFEIKIDISKELSSQFSVFSIPTIVVLFDKKEFKRYGRNISLSLFIEEIRRIYNLMDGT